MRTLLKKINASFQSSQIFQNSFWGVFSNIIQNLFLSLFFVILARHYSTGDFAHFLIANTLYQLTACFSSLGLGQWFIREIVKSTDRHVLVNQFLKMQLYFGLLFFVLNVIFAFVIYDDVNIHSLAILIGINIIFDNLIYSVRYVNIAQFIQRKTFIILAIEAFLKFCVGAFLFLYPLSIVSLTVVMILLRFVTLNLFLRLGSSEEYTLNRFWLFKLSRTHLKDIILKNWSFIVIGGISVLYWRISNIIVSKELTLLDVANYEISFKIFSIAQIIPMVISTTVFPTLIKLYNDGDLPAFKTLYRRMFAIYALYGVLSYTFIYTFGDFLIPWAFGTTYSGVPPYAKQMFLTMLIFPTGFLQANVLISMKLEKFDMYFNIIGLLVNITICLIGLHYVKSLTVVNLSLFASFMVFHLSQDVVLLRRKVASLNDFIAFYVFVGILVLGFTLLYDYFNSFWVLVIVWSIMSLALILPVQRARRKLLSGKAYG